MTTQFVVHLGRETVIVALLVTGPILIVGFVVGIGMSLIQAIMQLHEMTLAAVPKLFAIGATLVVFSHWMLDHMMTYTTKILGGFYQMIGHG